MPIFRGRRGASGVEYGVILGLIAVVVISAVAGSGARVKSTICNVTGIIGSMTNSGSLGCPGTDAPAWPSVMTPYMTTTDNRYPVTYPADGVSFTYPLPPAQTADNSPIFYKVLSANVAGSLTMNGTQPYVTVPVTPAGPMSGTFLAYNNGGATSYTFYSWAGKIGETGPFGTICAIVPNGTTSCSTSGANTITLYCPANPAAGSVSMPATGGTMTCSEQAFGTDPVPNCPKVCALQ